MNLGIPVTCSMGGQFACSSAFLPSSTVVSRVCWVRRRGASVIVRPISTLHALQKKHVDTVPLCCGGRKKYTHKKVVVYLVSTAFLHSYSAAEKC